MLGGLIKGSSSLYPHVENVSMNSNQPFVRAEIRTDVGVGLEVKEGDTENSLFEIQRSPDRAVTTYRQGLTGSEC